MSPFVWLVAMIVFILIEIITLGLTTIWFAGGALLAFIFNLAGLNETWQFVAFFVVSFLLILAVRPFATSRFTRQVEKTNVESMTGKEGRVIEKISNIQAKGRILVDGMEWTARTEGEEEISEGEIVTVLRVEGVKAIVTKKEK